MRTDMEKTPLRVTVCFVTLQTLKLLYYTLKKVENAKKHNFNADLTPYVQWFVQIPNLAEQY